MVQTRLGGKKRKREEDEEQSEDAPQNNNKGREKPVVPELGESAQKVFNITELREPIFKALIADDLSETMSSFANFRRASVLASIYANLTEQAIPGLPELTKQVKTLREALHRSAVHYALNVLEAGDRDMYTQALWEIPPVADQIEKLDYACIEAVHARRNHLNDKETARLVSILRARPELYVYDQSFALTPRHEMPQATANLLNIENVFNRATASLAASEHAKDMTAESRRHVNNAIRSVRAAVPRSSPLNGEPDFENAEIRERARTAGKAMLKYAATFTDREAEQASRRLKAGTERPANRIPTTAEAASPAQTIGPELPSSYDEVVKTLNEQAGSEKARVSRPRHLSMQSSTADLVPGRLAPRKQPTFLVDIYSRLDRTLKDTNMNDFRRFSVIEGIAAQVPNISPRAEIERIRSASARRTMDERGAGSRGIAD